MTEMSVYGIPVPREAVMLLSECLPRFRIHPMWGTEGSGAYFWSRWERDKEQTKKQGYPVRTWLRHSEFVADWGMRPVQVARGGFIGVYARWDILKKGFVFRGASLTFNFPRHTMQRAGRSEDFAELLARIPRLTDEFIVFECSGSSCSHREAKIENGVVVLEPGLTTSGAPAIQTRVW